MNTCSYGSIVDAYHDGELSPEARTAFEQHLVSCPPCQADLAQTRQLAAWITSAPKQMLSSTARQALFDLAPMIGERAYLRIAEWTTALAASVLIAASCWLMFSGKPQTSSPDQQASTFMPVFLNPPKEHDAADVPDDPKLVDWVTTNVAVAQNP